jgi:hypothetical protein
MIPDQVLRRFLRLLNVDPGSSGGPGSFSWQRTD